MDAAAPPQAITPQQAMLFGFVSGVATTNVSAYAMGYSAGAASQQSEHSPAPPAPAPGPKPVITGPGTASTPRSCVMKVLRVILPVLTILTHILSVLFAPIPPVSLAMTIASYAALTATCIVYSRTLANS